MRDADGYVVNCPIDPKPAFGACAADAKDGSPCLVDGDAAANFADCKDTTRSPVVHQWDRHAGALGGFIEQKLACRRNCANATAAR